MEEEDAPNLDDSDYKEAPAEEDDLMKRTSYIWTNYKARITSDLSRVAYLCSPTPQIIEHMKDRINLTPHVCLGLAVDRVIERLILPRKKHTNKNKDEVLSDLIDKFWKEHDEFVARKGYFARGHIWVAVEKEDCIAHEWHKRYSLGFTEVFGQVACLTCSPILGCGQAERNWKEYKDNLGGKRAKLAPEKAKKLSVIGASYNMK